MLTSWHQYHWKLCTVLKWIDSDGLPLVNTIDALWFYVTWLWSHFLSCFVYGGGHSLIVVCEINTERDSGTVSVSKQQESSLYSSCPGVTLVSAGTCGNHRVFSCLVILRSCLPGDHEPKHHSPRQVIFVRKGQTFIVVHFFTMLLYVGNLEALEMCVSNMIQ